ncbi:MAG: glycosyl transferase [Calothrix sp. C42_A2020_038]|nr:glycosyl transferase [Calothrix sp. C42_A2020_038]
MKKIMFYCQYLSGMGHLVRSTEIVRQLVKDFKVYFINGGPNIEGFEMPPEVEIIKLPALWLENGQFTVGNSYMSVEEVKEFRKNLLISEFDRIQPDCLITEFFPFGRHKLFFELIPFVKHIKSNSPNTKIACSLRDVIGKETNVEEEEIICNLMNCYFDLLLFHSDPSFQTFTESFSRHQDIKSNIIHTGFVTQTFTFNENDIDIKQLWGTNNYRKKILVSVGGGRIGYELLETVIEASSILKTAIPNVIKIFTGPFMPEEKVEQLKQAASNQDHQDNIYIERYTLQLLAYMKTADISISLSGYNTTMNILSTGVRALVVPIGHETQDKEQLIRTQKLEQMGAIDFIHPDNLTPGHLVEKILDCLSKPVTNSDLVFDMNGAENTKNFLKEFLDSLTPLQTMTILNTSPPTPLLIGEGSKYTPPSKSGGVQLANTQTQTQGRDN